MAKKNEITLSPKKTANAALKELHNEQVKTPEEVAENTSRELAVHGLKPKETFKIKDPITKEERTVSLSRTGTPEEDLIVALADPNMPRDRKDYTLSMYLWGRGAESASMMVDLMRYKGTHTKETRVFKSQMRFDFEALVDGLALHFETQAKNTAATLGIDLKQEIEGYRAWLKIGTSNAKTSYLDYYCGADAPSLQDRLYCSQISQAIFQLDEAERLTAARKNIAAAREREKGKGIYVAPGGKIYSIDDPEFDEVVKADREATAEIEHGTD